MQRCQEVFRKESGTGRHTAEQLADLSERRFGGAEPGARHDRVGHELVDGLHQLGVEGLHADRTSPTGYSVGMTESRRAGSLLQREARQVPPWQ